MPIGLDSRLRFIVRRLHEVGEEASAEALKSHHARLQAVLKGTTPGSLVEDLREASEALRSIEAILLTAERKIS